MKRVSLKGVAIGNIVDLVSSCIVGFLVAFYVLMSSAAFVKDIDAANQLVLASSVFWFWSVILGSLGSVLGGYVAARIARHDDVLNGPCRPSFASESTHTAWSAAARWVMKHCTSARCR